MQKIKLRKRDNFSPEEWLQKKANRKHVSNFISEPTVFLDELNRPAIIYGRIPKDFSELREELRSVKYNYTDRITTAKDGVAKKFRERQFGFRLSRAVRQNCAGACNFNLDYPHVYDHLQFLGRRLTEQYAEHAFRRYVKHKRQTDSMHPEWLIPGTIFNQGIVNNTAQLDYHYDRDNLHKVMSCMGVFRNSVLGGELIVPEYDIGIELKDHDYLIFDGQSILHGVAPIVKTKKDSFRFSIVFYAFRGFLKAGTFEEELQMFRRSMAKSAWGKYAGTEEI